uniref:Uncharacterized protein n=1 Tax=Globodera rostochiensis TaxID=31243 RepID=A0A914HJM3_GLORO
MPASAEADRVLSHQQMKRCAVMGTARAETNGKMVAGRRLRMFGMQEMGNLLAKGVLMIGKIFAGLVEMVGDLVGRRMRRLVTRCVCADGVRDLMEGNVRAAMRKWSLLCMLYFGRW